MFRRRRIADGGFDGDGDPGRFVRGDVICSAGRSEMMR